MNMDVLVEIAVLAFGPRWKGALSRHCGISRVQLWRYEKGMVPLPGVAVEKIKVTLRKHLEVKRGRIEGAIAVLDGAGSCA